MGCLSALFQSRSNMSDLASEEEDKAKLMPANEDIQQENQGNFILDVQVQVEIKEGRISIFHMGLPNNWNFFIFIFTEKLLFDL